MEIFFLINGETADLPGDDAWLRWTFNEAGIAVSSLRPGDAHTLVITERDEDGAEFETVISVNCE